MRPFRIAFLIGVILSIMSSAYPQGMDISGIAERAVRKNVADSAFDIHALLEHVRSDTSMLAAFRNVRRSSHQFYGHFDVSKWKRYGDRQNLIEWKGRFVQGEDSSYFVIDSVGYRGTFRRSARKRTYYTENIVQALLSGYSWSSQGSDVVLPQERSFKNSRSIKVEETILRVLDGYAGGPFGESALRYFDLFEPSVMKNFNYTVTNDCRGCSEPSVCFKMSAVPYAWKDMDWWGFGDVCFDQGTYQLLERQGFLTMRNIHVSFLVRNELKDKKVVPSYIYFDGSLPTGNFLKEHFTFAFGFVD